MTRRSDIAFLALAAWISTGGSCGDCPPVPQPEPMTELRAKEIDPALSEGVAFSTTWVSGDCRSQIRDTRRCPKDDPVDLGCFHGRTSIRIMIVPTNVSLPRSEQCMDRFAVADLRARAILDMTSSESGELVASIPAGRYQLYVSKDDQCATCGVAEDHESCLVDIPKNGIVARDLVLDEATH